MRSLVRMRDGRLGVVVSGALLSAVLAGAADAADGVVSAEVPDAGGPIDYAGAKPLPLPAVSDALLGTLDVKAQPAVDLGPAGGSTDGRPGTGRMAPVQLVDPALAQTSSSAADPGDVQPQEYGTYGIAYTTSRVDFVVPKGVPANAVSASYPNSGAGKLFFKIGAQSYICSASLIKKGLIVTAAHCVSEFGKNKIFSAHKYAPSYFNGSAPYGEWTGKEIFVLASYLKGTDPCWKNAPGVVCQNDVAVIVVNPKAGKYPGTTTGWLNYAYGGYSYVPDNQGVPRYPQISQLGYPASHDGGKLMQRTDSFGYVDDVYVKNTVIGSRQTGGSSGGPWIVNLGIPAQLNGTTLGIAPVPNVVVGVTSWGPTDTKPKFQGASPFLKTNIEALVLAACKKYAAACAK